MIHGLRSGGILSALINTREKVSLTSILGPFKPQFTRKFTEKSLFLPHCRLMLMSLARGLRDQTVEEGQTAAKEAAAPE